MRDREHKKQAEPVLEPLVRRLHYTVDTLKAGGLCPSVIASLGAELRSLVPIVGVDQKAREQLSTAWKSYSRFLAAVPEPARDPLLPPTEHNLKLWAFLLVTRVSAMSGSRPRSDTAKRYLNSLRRYCASRGADIPAESASKAHHFIRQLKRFDQHDTRSAAPLTPHTLKLLWRYLVRVLPSQTGAVIPRDRAQLFVQALVSFSAALRSGNAAGGVLLGDLQLLPCRRLIILQVRRGKRTPKTTSLVPLWHADSLLSPAHWLFWYSEVYFGLHLATMIERHPTWPLFPRRFDFAAGTASAWSPSQHTKRLRQALRSAGVSNWHRFTGHSGRHGFVTWAVDCGLELDIVAWFTGHKDLNSLRTYLQRSWHRLLTAAATLQTNPVTDCDEGSDGGDDEQRSAFYSDLDPDSD